MKNASAFTDRFYKTMQTCFAGNNLPKKIAVGVSGGADSMALCHALSDYVRVFSPQTRIYALSVDHRLRKESAEEVCFVREVVTKLPNVSHHTVIWEEGSEQGTRIEERAREARYGLFFEFMAGNDIEHLFVGHHQNDQAETFLFRLAKGSGLDGLACMPEMSETFHNGRKFILCRPLLGEQKSNILEFVREYSISYIEDPSNKDEAFARVRLRQSMDVLSKEGLSPKRLYMTAKRLKRARDALEYVSDIEYKKSIKACNTKTIVLEQRFLGDFPLEIVIRIILKAMEALKGESWGYGPRLERIENLCEDLIQPEPFRKRTLNGIIFERKDKSGEIVLSLEKRPKCLT